MRFMAPLAFLLGLLLPVIIAMYLLKLRRTEKLVSSTYLWQKMVRDLEANAPWQKLKSNLLLILQLLFLIAMIFSLARPFTWREGITGGAAILIFDTSASMAATDQYPNRLEAAKELARQLVARMEDGSRITLVSAGQEARVEVSSSLDRKQIQEAIEALRVGTGSSEMDIAIQMASAIAARGPDTEIIIFSDGGVSLPRQFSVEGEIRYIKIGKENKNQGIALLDLRPYPGREQISAFIQAVNYGSEASTRRLAVYADSQLVDVYDVDLPAGSEQAVLVENLPSATQVVEARLLPVEKSQDYLAEDDRAFSVYRQVKPVRAVLVSEGNIFLQTALNLFPGMQTKIIPPDQSENISQADLVIYDSHVPVSTTLPQTNLFFVAPLRSTEYFTVTSKINAPIPRPAEDNSLLTHVSLDGVNILDAQNIQMPDWAKAVIISEDLSNPTGDPIPLMFVGEVNGRRIGVLAFDLHRSDLPLQISFPILIANLIQWFAPGRGGEIPTQVSPGETVSLRPSFSEFSQDSTSFPTVIRPDGSSWQPESKGTPIIYADTWQLGVYQVEWEDGETASFAVNLFSPQESKIAPIESLPASGINTEQNGTAFQPARYEWWRLGVSLALVMLVLEWLYYQRPALRQVFNRVRSR